jgi:hypothetical protein
MTRTHTTEEHVASLREVVFSTRSVQQLRDATIQVLLGEVFSLGSVPKCYNLDESTVKLVVRQSQASKDVNTGAEEATGLEAVTRRQPVKIQQTEKA